MMDTKTKLRGEYLKDRNAYVVADEPIILHCHHYNIFLQASLEDAKEYIDILPVLVDSAQEVVYAQLHSFFTKEEIQDVAERKSIAEDFFRFAGYGKIDMQQLTAEGGKAVALSDHYGIGWKLKFGERCKTEGGVSYFTSGFLAGATEAIFELPHGIIDCEQLTCIAKGDSHSTFKVFASANRKELSSSPKTGVLQDVESCKTPQDTDINYEAVQRALSSLPIEGTEESGLIDAFGVFLTRMYANYYTLISYRFLNMMEEQMGAEGVELAGHLLTEAGHVCAFNTFGGIMQSAEWYGLVHPMIKKKEDWVHGIVAVANTFGWGVWEIEDLIGDEKLVVNIKNGYESNSYLKAFGKSRYPVSFLAKGGISGIMNLIYNGDISTKPELNEEYYREVFTSGRRFHTEQTKCRAMGDTYDQFVATITDQI